MVSFSFPMDEGRRVNDSHPDIEMLRKPWVVLPARASASIPGPQSSSLVTVRPHPLNDKVSNCESMGIVESDVIDVKDVHSVQLM
mmetsp:Transcript_27814/g.50263  ORF Transcript_27814/g.50263 Transcript_27814/m.50263 type:complete len:85 (+) Transcript_27814:551-805(+)